MMPMIMEERALKIGPAALAFSRELYAWHLEELSFLYGQYEERLESLEGKAAGDDDDTDQRIGTHLNALEVGETIAIDVCLSRMNEGDAGILYATVRLFCRLNRNDLLDETSGTIDPHQKKHINAMIRGLRQELPPERLSVIVSENDVLQKGLS